MQKYDLTKLQKSHSFALEKDANTGAILPNKVQVSNLENPNSNFSLDLSNSEKPLINYKKGNIEIIKGLESSPDKLKTHLENMSKLTDIYSNGLDRWQENVSTRTAKQTNQLVFLKNYGKQLITGETVTASTKDLDNKVIPQKASIVSSGLTDEVDFSNGNITINNFTATAKENLSKDTDIIEYKQAK